MKRATVETIPHRKPIWLLGLVGLPILLLLDRRFGIYAEPVVLCGAYVGLAAWLWGRAAGYVAALGSTAIIIGAIRSQLPTDAPSVALVWLITARPAVFFASALILATLRASLDRERLAARRDMLTGVDNRLAFEEKAETAVRRAKRRHTPLTMAFIDCDDFKTVNDTLGHEAGDELLRVIGQTLRANVRPEDVVARVGGDEFAVVFYDCKTQVPHVVIRRLRRVLSEELKLRGWNVTLSIGVATFKSVNGTYRDILRAADKLQYSAKATGKNAVLYGVVDSRDPRPTQVPGRTAS
jgi:diguanylate cyclase (GGDEF)-like protein